MSLQLIQSILLVRLHKQLVVRLNLLTQVKALAPLCSIMSKPLTTSTSLSVGTKPAFLACIWRAADCSKWSVSYVPLSFSTSAMPSTKLLKKSLMPDIRRAYAANGDIFLFAVLQRLAETPSLHWANECLGFSTLLHCKCAEWLNVLRDGSE